MALPRMLEAFRKAKQAEIAALRELSDKGALPAAWQGERPSFLEALRSGAKRDGIAVIAEYKRASPSQGLINDLLGPEDVAAAYAKGGASALSVLTEEDHFQGDLAFLERMRPAGLPLLRKDFLLDPLQIPQTAATPASALLLIVRMLEPSLLAQMIELAHNAGLDAVVEAFDENDVRIAQDVGARIIQINNRDLDTLTVDLETSARLIQRKRIAELWISASGMGSNAELVQMQKLGYEAALVGTSLMRTPDPGEALENMRRGG